MDLAGGSAIVTGAAGGIGSVVTAKLAARGLHVVAADLDAAGLEQMRAKVASDTGSEVEVVVGDVSDADHHRHLVETALKSGPLVLSVLNAGISKSGLSWEMPIATWEMHLNVNYWGVVHGLRAAVPAMIDQDLGWVVAVASGAGLVATPGLAPYVSTKHAVVGMMESVHHELNRIDSAVGASVICPGNIATGMATPKIPEDDSEAGADADDASRVAAQIEETIRAGVAAGAPPSTVADAIIEGVSEEKFWLFSQPEIAWAGHDRMERMYKGDPPVDLLG